MNAALDFLHMQLLSRWLDIQRVELVILNHTTRFHPLAISNHVSEFDPFLLWYVFRRHNVRYRFISDQKVRQIPVLGWLSDLERSIYIDRNNPSAAIQCLQEQMTLTDHICLFPEGTLYYKPTIEHSHALCRKLGVAPFTNVLCPKRTGYTTVGRLLQPARITDLTIHYRYADRSTLRTSPVPLTMLYFLQRPPQQIIVTIREKPYLDIMVLFREKDRELTNSLAADDVPCP